MRPKGRSAAFARVKREVVRWIYAGVFVVLLAAAFLPSFLGWRADGASEDEPDSWREGDAQGRRLTYPDDLLIDKPYGDAANGYLIFIHIILILYMLLGINTVCDVYFTNALEVMWTKWRIKPDIAGATFMAAGGSAPEFFTSLIGAFAESDVGFGTIVGSAVFNVLFVIGLCGFVSKTPISLTWWPLFRDCTYYIFGLSLLAICARDWAISLGEALLLFAAYLAYCGMMYFNDRAEAWAMRKTGGAAGADAQGAPAKPSQVAPMPAEEEVASAPVGGSESGALGGEHAEDALRDMGSGEAPPGPPEHHIGRAQQPDSPCAALPMEAGDAECSAGCNSKDGEFTIGGFEPGDLDAKDKAFFGKAASDQSELKKGEVEGAAAEEGTLQGEQVKEEGGEEDDEEEEDPIDELMTKPEGTKDFILWVLSMPIILPIWLFIPRPTETKFLFTFLFSLVWIACLTYLLVWWIETAGEVFHIHYIIMSLTVLAAGTSIPDAVSSVAVARKGLGDTAVSSSIGSNIFDILIGLPVPWLIKILCVEGNPGYAVRIQSPYMTFFVLLLLFMVFCVVASIHALGWKLNRPLGLCMALLYGTFLAIALFVYAEKPEFLNF